MVALDKYIEAAIQLMGVLRVEMEKTITDLFIAADMEKDGGIDIDEFKMLCIHLNSIKPPEAEKIFYEFADIQEEDDEAAISIEGLSKACLDKKMFSLKVQERLIGTKNIPNAIDTLMDKIDVIIE